MKLCMCLLAALCAASPALAQQKGKSDWASQDMHQMVLNAGKASQSMKLTGDVDYDFVVMMRHNHQTAVRIAEHEMQHGKDEKAKQFAKKIAESHQQEMKQLDAWLQARRGAQK